MPPKDCRNTKYSYLAMLEDPKCGPTCLITLDTVFWDAAGLVVTKWLKENLQ